MKLSDCLNTYASILGPNCEILGKATGSCFLTHQKNLLSWTKQKGWEVVQLDILQLFFRYVLGTSPSTHLDFIHKKINTLKLTTHNENCLKRIQAIWERHNLIGVGNAPFSEASIICFAEKHTDQNFKDNTLRWINTHYRQGDVVLVEGIEAGEDFDPDRYLETQGLNKSCTVRGWEPQNFRELIGSVFQSRNRMDETLRTCYKNFNTGLVTEGKWSREEFLGVKEKTEELMKELKKLNELYKLECETILKDNKLLDRFFAILEKDPMSMDDPGAILSVLVWKIFKKIEEVRDKAFYNNITAEDSKKIHATASLRNTSLVEEIRKFREENEGRVFVIAGAAHLLQTPDYPRCDDVKDLLGQNKFITILRKSHFTSNVARINSDLTTFDL